ncbi:MAG: hypothetical protein IIB75_09225 [Proteobacteria bacterium]|nr:hypothetical protein [Pseudomonadota bacterium]
MQAIAKWLVARPQNAVLGLASTLMLPAPQLTSGVIMVLLVLAQGPKLAAYKALLAGVLLAAMSLLAGLSLPSMMVLMVATWIPVMLLAVLLATTRSLTLTLQVSVIITVVAMLLFQIVVTDAAAYWQPYLDVMSEIMKQNGLQLDTEVLTPDVMTISAALALWLIVTAGLFLGYWLYRLTPVETRDFGRFQDLDLGRVIAFAAALAALLAFVIDAAWLANIAFVLLAMFLIQGLSIMHWLRGKGILPVAALIAVYVLMPILQVVLVMVLALVGYGDAWFGFRRRFGKA